MKKEEKPKPVKTPAKLSLLKLLKSKKGAFVLSEILNPYKFK